MTTKKTMHAISKTSLLLDRTRVMGLGTVDVSPEQVLVRVSVSYLKTAIKVLETMDQDSIVLAIKKDDPLILGAYDENKKKIAGVLIAPRMED